MPSNADAIEDLTLRQMIAQDKLERARLAQNLVRQIKRSRRDLNVAVCAPFGSGKTFFLHLLTKYMRKKSIATVYIDIASHQAFGSPIFSVLDELRAFVDERNVVSEEMKKSFTRAFVETGKFAGKLGAKIAVKAFTGITVEDEDLAELFEKEAGKKIDKIFESHETTKKKISEIKSALSQLRGDIIQSDEFSDQRIFIVVDELDRCEPEFSRKLLGELRCFLAETGFCLIVGFDSSRIAGALSPALGMGGRDEYAESYVEKYFDETVWLETKWQGGIVRRWISNNKVVRSNLLTVLNAVSRDQESRSAARESDDTRVASYFVRPVATILRRQRLSIRQTLRALELFERLLSVDPIFIVVWRSSIALCMKAISNYEEFHSTVLGHLSFDDLKKTYGTSTSDNDRIFEIELLLYAHDRLDVLLGTDGFFKEFKLIERSGTAFRYNLNIVDAFFRKVLLCDDENWSAIVGTLKAGGRVTSNVAGAKHLESVPRRMHHALIELENYDDQFRNMRGRGRRQMKMKKFSLTDFLKPVEVAIQNVPGKPYVILGGIDQSEQEEETKS